MAQRETTTKAVDQTHETPFSATQAVQGDTTPELATKLAARINAGILICDDHNQLVEWNGWVENWFSDLGVTLVLGETFCAIENRLVENEAIISEHCRSMPDHQLLQLQDMDQSTSRIWTMPDRSRIIVAGRTCPDGSIERVMVSAADTSDREAELKGAMRAAEAASRSKTQFLTTMSHELRTPLNAVIGFSDLMLCESEGPLGNDTYKEFAESINQSGHHLLELINQILDLSRIEAGRFELRIEDVDITHLVDHCIRIVSVNAEDVGVALVTKYDECDNISADSQAIKQVVLNLLSNAIKFTPEGGHITVTLLGSDGKVFIQVADTGIGIPEDDIENLTTPFEQASNSSEGRQQGYGLGLAISKELIELHGGHVGIQSVLGTGTTVTITLPVSA